MFRKPVLMPLVIAFALVGAGAAAQAQSGPTLQSSSQKYREKNMTGAKGRAGGATLAARLLYAKDGTTVLDATTGSDFSTETGAPGTSFWKIQVAALDS